MEQSRAVTVFNFQGNDLRVKMVDGEPWFVVSDACKFLEIANIGNAISRLDRDGVRQADVIDSLGRMQSTAIANEPNLYRLIFRSDKPEAKAFQDWVYNEVLPSIRKTGGYGFSQDMSWLTDFNQEIDQTIGHIALCQRMLESMKKQQRQLAGQEPSKPASKVRAHDPAYIEAEIVRHLGRRGPLTLSALGGSYMKWCDPFELEQAMQRLVLAGRVQPKKSSWSVSFELAESVTLPASVKLDKERLA